MLRPPERHDGPAVAVRPWQRDLPLCPGLGDSAVTSGACRGASPWSVADRSQQPNRRSAEGNTHGGSTFTTREQPVEWLHPTTLGHPSKPLSPIRTL